MKLKQKINVNQIIKKYWLWLILIVAFFMIPATNSKYLLQKSATFELKPDRYNLTVSPITTIISSSADKINFRVTNSNSYPIILDIIYKGNVISTGITVPANTNYGGTFDITQNVYDEIFNDNGAEMDIKVMSPYSVEYPNTVIVKIPEANLARRLENGDFFGNNFDITKVAKVSFSNQGVIPPASALGSFDVSDGHQGNVVAWYTKNANNPNMYDVVISANGKVKSKNPEYLLAGFTGLKEVDFTNFDVNGKASLMGLLKNTTSLKNINWGGIDTSSVQVFSHMFANSGVENLDLSTLDWSNVREASSMFSDADKLERINLTGINTVSLTNMSSMFKGTKSLKYFNPADLNVSKVVNLSSAFAGTGGATSYDFSSWDVSKVVDFTYMFDGANDLKNINLSGWDVSNGERFYNMFQRMGNIEEIDVSSFHPIKARAMSGMFQANPKLKKVIFNNFDTRNVVNMDLMFADNPELIDLDVTSFKTGNVQSFNNMFRKVSKLKNLDVSNFDTKSARSFSSMFSNCFELKELNVKDWNMSNAQNLYAMFSGYEV